jgi:pheromone shutdown protein TraB
MATAGTTTSIMTEGDSLSATLSSSSAVAVAVPPLPSALPTDNAPPTQQQQRPDNWFQRKAMDFATATVGNALKGMYTNLGNAGFKPGEEFAAAIRAGQAVGATIVLGDRDVELTLRRLTQALAVTDFNKLLDPSADFEKALADLGGGGPSVIEPMLQDFDNPAEFKRALSAYVEKLKDRRSIANVMTQLNEVAPALVQVMLTERDAYMATGIDTLNDFECMVAVMGLAHQDGVERNLRQYGWKQVRPACR